MQKLHAKKIMTCMTDSSDACNSDLDINENDHAIKNYDALQSKLSNWSPIPFVLLEHKVALFLINDEEAVHFMFDKSVQMQMILCYFTIKLVEATKSPLCLFKDGKTMLCVMLPTMSFASNEWCYTNISNGWLTLDKCGSFKALDNYDANNY